MAIAVSGIDPVQVLSLVGRIKSYSTAMDNQIFAWLRTDLRRSLADSYGGQAADSLLERILRLASAVDAKKEEMMKDLKTNIQDDLDSTKNMDIKLI